ncbi:MAG: PocR ligand-binding domain-containing protein [Treponema sp.]|jgi:AraC-like DNA-binding protein/ligand-binding sensor protein|nr:PocR ligand-binding domain-containing protein [Treponema sp.]
MAKSLSGTIIKNRDTEPLLSKAGSILTAYEQAADCVVSVIDSDGESLIPPKDTAAVSLCSYCCKHTLGGGCNKPDEGLSCGDVHQKGIEESRRLGSSYIYMCPLGLVFWVSPLYSGGRYAGALMAGNVLGIEREEVLERVQSSCSDSVAVDRIRNNLETIPRRDYEEIKALAQMMLICAQQISAGAGITGSGAGNSANISTTGTTGAALFGKNEDQQNPGPSVPVFGTAEEQPSAVVARLPETAQPSSNERLLIAALRRGDSNAGRRILEDIFDDLKVMCPDDLRFYRCRAIELVVFLSRSCTPEKTSDPLLEENNLYLKKINDSTTIEELQINLHRIVERMAGRIFSFHGLRHASALRRAERFIWKNYTRKVSLEEIATASGLSAPYFSTIFREEMGEHLSTHLNRLRVEKACTMLLETRATLNEISESCGFEDQSWFSKIFKSYTGYSPGKYREQGGMNYSLDNYHVG